MFENISIWFQINSILALGILLTIVGIIFTISEFVTYYKHKAPSDQLLFWLMALLAGISTILTNDLVFGLLLGISLLMIVETIKMWSTPVWGKLMAATTSTYMVILIGKAGQLLHDYIVKPEKPNEEIFVGAFTLAFPIFLLISFIFFGRKFLLVSKFSSPNMVYLILFGVVYGGIARLQDKVFPVDKNGFIGSLDYLGIGSEWTKYVIFADFGTYEALSLVMIFIYFISGWMLTVLMGVKPVTDPVLLEKVDMVAKRMGIKGGVKVGYSPAPILNAFAYGPFFDKRVAFISGDIDDFTDADIRGIVGHELAHASRHHVLILLGLSILELAIKKALLLPATTIDYWLLADKASASKLDFAGYYIFSYFLFALLLIVVRFLEGDADAKTKDAGYGEDLTQALFRLEGFYNGVASDLGVSVNLLTDRRYSLPEKRRFTAQAASSMYQGLLEPSRMGAFGNIFQSHPKTVYRISNLVKEERNPRMGALLPYRLLGFFMRKKAMKELISVANEFHTAIDKSYNNDYGGEALVEVLRYNSYEEIYDEFKGKQVLAFNVLTKKVTIGEFSSTKITNRATSPVYGIINEEEIDLSINTINEYTENERYFLKDGSIVILDEYSLEKDDLKFKVTKKGGKSTVISQKLLGKPVSFMSNLKGKEVIHFKQGLSRLNTITNVEINGSWSDSTIVLGDETYKGRDLIISFSPIGFDTRKSMKEQQLPLLQSLKGEKIAAFTKENFDVSLSGTVEDVNMDRMILKDADGDQEIKLDDLEYVILAKETVEVINSEHISLFTKFGLWWSNRNKFTYIIGK